MSASTIFQAIGYKLINESDITAIVGAGSAARVYHGNRPAGSAPCINYFEVGYIPLHNGVVETPRYQISCRASTPEVAQDLARKVAVLFHNFQGVVDGFDINRTTVEGKLLLSEPETNLYHVPVDVRFVFNDDSISS